MICKYSLIKSTNIETIGNIFLVKFPSVSTIDNKDNLVLIIGQNFCNLPSNLVVNFEINDCVFSVMTQNGDFVRANQIKSNKVYVVNTSTETNLMIMRTYLPPSGIKYPSLSSKIEKLVS